MKKQEFESSRHDWQSDGNESSTVQVPAGSYSLTEEDRERLRRLASLPDSEINFSDIPRLTPEEYESAKRAIVERKAHLRKAS